MPPKLSSKSVKTTTPPPNIKTVGETIGYLRVSTGDQELEKNKSDIAAGRWLKLLTLMDGLRGKV